MHYSDILANTIEKDKAYGTVTGRLKPSPFTFCRVTTNDSLGLIQSYVGEGEITDDAAESFGGYGVVRIQKLQKLLAHICENGYEHHVGMNRSRVAGALEEAFSKYLGWLVYHHEA